MATVIVPYVHGMLNPGTYRAVRYSGHYYRFVDLDPIDPGNYGRLIRQLWRSQATVVICEHDVIPTREQIDTICWCCHDWCGFSYNHPDYHPGPSLGLTRFSAHLMALSPLTAERATLSDRERGTERGWRDLDAYITRDLTIQRVEWHEHSPPVDHAHQAA